MKIAIKIVDPRAQLPEKSRPHDAAYDLRALDQVIIEPGNRQLIDTGLAIAVPEGYAALVLARSGLALKHGIAPANAPGLIDANYRGNLAVILENRGSESFTVEPGARIAQLLITSEPTSHWLLVDELPPSLDDRGSAGFGSSGQD